MRKRTQGRELALQLLYQVDLLRTLDEAEREKFLGEHAEGPEVREFARSLVAGVAEHQTAIDREIEEVAKNWELGRMAIIDRNILRMGVLELCYRGEEVPPKVAINEAVDLAKKYSTKNSSAFVNGILDKVRERFAAGGSAAGPVRPQRPTASKPPSPPQPPPPAGADVKNP